MRKKRKTRKKTRKLSEVEINKLLRLYFLSNTKMKRIAKLLKLKNAKSVTYYAKRYGGDIYPGRKPEGVHLTKDLSGSGFRLGRGICKKAGFGEGDILIFGAREGVVTILKIGDKDHQMSLVNKLLKLYFLYYDVKVEDIVDLLRLPSHPKRYRDKHYPANTMAKAPVAREITQAGFLVGCGMCQRAGFGKGDILTAEAKYGIITILKVREKGKETFLTPQDRMV